MEQKWLQKNFLLQFCLLKKKKKKTLIFPTVSNLTNAPKCLKIFPALWPTMTAFNKTALEKFQEMARAYVAAAFKDKNQVWVARNSD